jgi:hypothetical protein
MAGSAAVLLCKHWWIFPVLFTLQLYFSQRFFKKVAPLYIIDIIGAPLLQMCHRLLASLWQIFYRRSESIGIPLGANFLQATRSYWQLSDKFLRGY